MKADSRTRDIRLLALLVAVLCPAAGAAGPPPLRLVYANWSTSVASERLACLCPRRRHSHPGAYGLAGDMPEVYRFPDRFHWDQSLLGRLMVWIETDARHDPYAQALRWLRAHPAQARAWLD